MTTATAVIALALNTAGVVGVDQAPQAQDLADCFTVLVDMLGDWQLARTNQGNPADLGNYTFLGEDVTFPPGYDNAILWGLTARIRPMFGLPPDEATSNLAANSYKLVQSINRQQGEKLTPRAVETVEQLIQLALRLSGRSTDVQRVAADSQDMFDAFGILGMMMAQWQRKRWLVPSLSEIVIPSTGALSYQLGPPAQGFNPAFFNPASFETTPNYGLRTDRIESAFVRLTHYSAPAPVVAHGPGFNPAFFNPGAFVTGSGAPAQAFNQDYFNPAAFVTGAGPPQPVNHGLLVDFPLAIIGSREDYNRIAVKALSTFPFAVFYDAAFPTASLYFWPVPPAGQFEMHLFVKATLQTFATVKDTLSVPPEYVEAMLYNLAIRLGLNFGTDVRPGVVQMAKASLNTVRMANIQVPEMRMPGALLSGRWSGGYAGFLTGGAI